MPLIKHYPHFIQQNFGFSSDQKKDGDRATTPTPRIAKNYGAHPKSLPSKEFQNLKNKIEIQLQQQQQQQQQQNSALHQKTAGAKTLVYTAPNKNRIPLILRQRDAVTKTDPCNLLQQQQSTGNKKSIAIRLQTEDDESSRHQTEPLENRIQLNEEEASLDEKAIDLEFKNELECLFSLTTTHPGGLDESVAVAPRKNTAKLTKRDLLDESTKSNAKLISLFRLIGGHLIKDYSELLVDYDGDEQLQKQHHKQKEKQSDSFASSSLGCYSTLSTRSFTSSLISAYSSAETSTEFSDVDLGSTSSIDNTIKLFRFIKNDILLENFDYNTSMSKQDSDKILNLLIKLLAKSCGVFDVATTMKSEANMHYWRYANPVVAAFKRTKNAVSLSYLKKCDASVQVAMDSCNSKETEEFRNDANRNRHQKQTLVIKIYNLFSLVMLIQCMAF